MAVPAASPCSQNRHLHALKGTSQHWRPIAFNAMPRRRGGRKMRERRKNSEAQSCNSLLLACLSFSLCFPCLSHPLHCQSASSPIASIFLSLPVGSHQSEDLPWMLALSANYTVYLTTLTAMAKKISASLFANPQLGKQHFSEYSPPTDEFKLTCSSMQADGNSYTITKRLLTEFYRTLCIYTTIAIRVYYIVCCGLFDLM